MGLRLHHAGGARDAAGTAQSRPGADNVTLHTLPGSKFSFTRAQIANRYGPADWFPEDHPAMPDIVAHGKESAQPQVFACGLCHLPNGNGRPENANITGLSYEYIVQQLIDFRNGARKTSDPRKSNTGLMTAFAKMMTDEAIRASARYFTSIPVTPWIRVVESATVPRTRPQNGMFLVREGADAGVEPIGERIIETPERTHDTEFLRNPRSGFIAYVPPGSLKKGESLVMNGITSAGGKVTACPVCHGSQLPGLGPVPRFWPTAPLGSKSGWGPRMRAFGVGLLVNLTVTRKNGLPATNAARLRQHPVKATRAHGRRSDGIICMQTRAMPVAATISAPSGRVK